MAFEFKRKQAKGHGSTLDDKEMADRIKHEAERFKEATNSSSGPACASEARPSAPGSAS